MEDGASGKRGGGGGGGAPALKRSASVASTVSAASGGHSSTATSSPRRFSISPRRASTRLGGRVLRARPKTPPAHKAQFSVPSIAWQQAGGFYSDAELPGGNVEGCPNWKNPAHHCTTYCFERFAPLSQQERFLAAASAASSAGAQKGSGTGTTGTSGTCRVS